MLENLYSERQILAKLSTDYDADLSSKLEKDDFNLLEHRMLYESLVKNKGNIEMVINEGLGIHIEDTLNKVVLERISISKLDHHLEVIKKHTMKRRVLSFAEELKAKVYSDDIGENILNDLENIISTIPNEEGRTVGDLFKEYLDEYDMKPKFVKTGTDLDLGLTMEEGDLIILAARPSMGKTAFQFQMAINAGKLYQEVLCFSLEMKDKQIIKRIIANECDIEMKKVREKNLTESEKNRIKSKVQSSIKDLPIKIYDNVFSLDKIKDIAIKHKKEKGLKLLMIDYLQLMDTAKKSNRNQEVGEITRELKKFAKKLGVVIVLLSQLSRGVENRADKRPLLSDLRDSGEIEQDVDSALFLYRDEYYNENSELKNIIELIIRKQRQGELKGIPMYFDGAHQRIRDLTFEERGRIRNVINSNR